MKQVKAGEGRFLMRSMFLLLVFLLVVMTGGCAGTTPINKLALPPVTIIAGTVSGIDDQGFTLRDDSGEIHVRAEMPENRKLELENGEKITVYGNLLGGREKIFDGYVIRKSTGENIIISMPTPHFGFILQTSFQED